MSSEMPPDSVGSPQPPVRSRRRKNSQERVMVMFTLFFALGIFLLVLIPEGHSARGMAMGVYSVLVFWSVFRFGV